MSDEPKPVSDTPAGIEELQSNLEVSSDFLQAIDEWRGRQPDKPSREAVIKRLADININIQTHAPNSSDPKGNV